MIGLQFSDHLIISCYCYFDSIIQPVPFWDLFHFIFHLTFPLIVFEIIFTKDDIFNWYYQDVAFPLLAYLTWLPQDFFLVKCLLNILDIILQAMNALQELGRYWKEVVGKYMKE